jgi:hypothetical protein
MRKQPNYLYLVFGLSASIILMTSTSAMSPMGTFGVICSAVTLVATAYLVSDRKLLVLLAVALGTSALLPLAWFSIHPGGLPPSLAKTIYMLDLLFWLLFTFTTVFIVFRGIMTAGRVRANEIYGAIYVYLLIGVLFAQGYQLLLAVQPDALFFEPGRFAAPPVTGSGLSIRGAGDLVYFSFVTLGTVGYGDATPASPLARSVSMVEEVIGIMYVATMIARFVSLQTADGVGAPQRPK